MGISVIIIVLTLKPVLWGGTVLGIQIIITQKPLLFCVVKGLYVTSLQVKQGLRLTTKEPSHLGGVLQGITQKWPEALNLRITAATVAQLEPIQT